MKKTSSLLAFAALTSASAALAATPPRGALSVHERDLRLHEAEALSPRILPPQGVLRSGKLKSVEKVVYGYLPYWSNDLTTLQWDSLTHIAWFAVEMNEQGGADALHGWPDMTTVQAAHDAGVRVDLAFTLFSGAGIKALVNDPARRAAGIKTMLDLAQQGGADGVSVDFEGFIDGTRDGFTAFVTELRAEVKSRGLADFQISLAGPAVDWGDEWDVAALLKSADYLFLMEYDFFYGGSNNAGPSGILRTDAAWSKITTLSALRSIAHYTTFVSPEGRRQILYGVPYYGREWTTSSMSPAAPTIASVGSVTYASARADLDAGQTRQWDDGVKSPWYAWQSAGTAHEVYYEDDESLSHKYQLARQQDLGGVGMWALNYDAPYAELWDVLAKEMGPQPAPAEGHRLAPIVVGALPYHDERDTTVGPSQYFNYYSCAPDLDEYGREWVYQLDVCQPGKLGVHVPVYPDHDPDVHLLTDVVESACVARADSDIEQAITPGRYYVVVDTYVSKGVELAGNYALDIDFAADAGSQPCAAHLQCVAGVCACPTAGQTDCGGTCVDVQSDAAHCGACDNACDASETCVNGACQAGAGVGGAGGSGGSAGSGGSGSGGNGGQVKCACSVPGGPAGEGGVLAAALCAVAGALRGAKRRRRRE